MGPSVCVRVQLRTSTTLSQSSCSASHSQSTRNSNHGQEVPHKWPMSNLLWNDPDHDVIGVFHLKCWIFLWPVEPATRRGEPDVTL